MATVNISATFCPGQGHAHVTLLVNGTNQGQWTFILSDVTGTPDDMQKREWVANFIRLHKIGKTDGQLRTNLQSGITVTI